MITKFLIVMLILQIFWSDGVIANEEIKTIKVAIVVRESAKKTTVSSNHQISLKTTQLALNERKEELSKKGYKLEIHDFYYKEDKLSGFHIAKELELKGFDVVIGFQASESALSAAKAIAGSTLTILSPFATTTKLIPHSKNVVQLAGNNGLIAKDFGKFIRNNFGNKKILIVASWDNSYTRDFSENLGIKDLQSVETVKVLEHKLDLSKALSVLQTFDPDIVINENYPYISGSIVQSFSKAGFKGTFISADAWGEGTDSRFMKLVKDSDFKGLIYRKYSRFNPNPQIRSLSKRLDFVSRAQLPISSCLFYDSANLFVDTILKIPSASYSRGELQHKLTNMKKYQGIAGEHCLTTNECAASGYHKISVNSSGYKLLERK